MTEKRLGRTVVITEEQTKVYAAAFGAGAVHVDVHIAWRMGFPNVVVPIPLLVECALGRPLPPGATVQILQAVPAGAALRVCEEATDRRTTVELLGTGAPALIIELLPPLDSPTALEAQAPGAPA